MPSHTRKSWSEKLTDAKDLPKVVTISEKMCRRFKTSLGDTCVIPAPLEVDALMRQIPRGELITINELRLSLAKTHNATIACPMCTGIFAWIAAHAAVEANPKKPATPYWRTLKATGEINPKFPGGPVAVAKLLRAEGHKIIKKGERYFVADFSQCISKL
jgi:hypothetical protein